MKRKNVLGTAAVVAGVVALVLLVPLPHRVTCPVEIRPADCVHVYVRTPGLLDEVLVEPGQIVEQNQVIVRLVNHRLQRSVAELASEQRQKEAELAALRRQRHKNPTAANSLSEVAAELAAIEEQLRELRHDLAELEIRAPVAGTVLAAPSRSAPPQKQGELPSWSGTPLDAVNLHMHLEESLQVCSIGDPRRAEAILIVDQGDVELVRVGQRVALKLDAFTRATRYGAIAEIAQADLTVASPGLAQQAGGTLATRTDRSGEERPLSASYQARVPLDGGGELYRFGMRGSAKVYCPWQTLGWRLWRGILRTFRFEM